MNSDQSILNTNIEYFKGVGAKKAEVIQKEIGVFKAKDLLGIFPFRYVDKTQFHLIKDLSNDGDTVQVKGKLISLEKIRGKNNRYRLTGMLKDSSGFLELIWFQGVKWLVDILIEGEEYIVFGKLTIYRGKRNITHPEMELLSEAKKKGVRPTFDPVYSSTEKLNTRGFDNKVRRQVIKNILSRVREHDFPENLPKYLLEKLKLCSRYQAMNWIHCPTNASERALATNRIKFEELFYLQMKLLVGREKRKRTLVGPRFEKVGALFNQFYHEGLAFELTGAQKRVLKEIRVNTANGVHMNRLVQGDVGSGKTVVGFMSMLLAIDNGYQACMMAPTQILAQQHYSGMSELAKPLGLRVGYLSGSVKKKERITILDMLRNGDIDILIGTHALIEDPVVFKNLGIAIIDEQHRFGVAQRAKLWKKNTTVAPHVLVMTATPIPRTLAMTVYGDLDVSKIDEMPPGRKSVQTVHRFDSARARVIKFMRAEIDKGRQVYVVYPLIEESETLDLRNLTDGYERLLTYFPRPQYQMSMLHGRMKPEDKDHEMERFAKGITQIMVATTVIEVGVNVPNASVMVIENTERFGLSQLHQLRGRVGRGADQSFCILMTGNKLTKVGKERIATMVRTTDGFEIAEADLKLRGPGDIEGTMQSGIMDLKLSSLTQDEEILSAARFYAEQIVTDDPSLKKEVNKPILSYFVQNRSRFNNWGRIS